MQETQAQSLGQEDPWRREWHPIPVFLPGESRGRRSLVGYSPQGHKESDTTEATEHTHTHAKHKGKQIITDMIQDEFSYIKDNLNLRI